MIFKYRNVIGTALLAIPLCLVVSAVGMTQDTTEGDDSAQSQNTFQPKTEDAGFPPGGFGTGASAEGYPAPAGGMLTNERLLQGTHIMISWSKNNDELRGYSQKSGEWTSLKIKKQKTIAPLLGGNFAIVTLDDAIAAYSGTTEKWVVLETDKYFKNQQKLQPIVNDDLAAVRVGDAIAAYSETTGNWAVLELSKDSDAQPTVSTNWVQTTDNDYLYTFAAAKGKWTSPNDPKFRAPEADDKDAVGNPFIIPGFGPSTIPGSAPIDDRLNLIRSLGLPLNQAGLAERIVKVIQNYRGKGLDNDEARKALTEVVENAFDLRQKHQKAEADRLAEKLKKIQEAIEKRESLRDKIIQRRVDELLDPNVEWESAFPKSGSSSYGTPGAPVYPGTSR